MQLNSTIKPIAESLLQQYLDGKLKSPKDVLATALKFQPVNGLDNQEWTDLCEFIMSIDGANNVPAAKIIAEEHGFTLEIRDEMVS